MPTIRILSDEVINRIAAGEVVENPSSVIKELLENSVDANSSSIKVSIYGGGLENILVEDDGCGMSREDALLSIKRHATSKISTFEDLEVLQSMGFRGEALSAISSVSQFRMTTSLGEEAFLIDSNGLLEEAVRGRGTSVEVKSLFYNVPARKKFQKSTKSCSADVGRVLREIALSHREIAFSFFSEDREVFNSPSLKGINPEKALKARAEDVLDDFRIQDVKYIHFERDNYRVEGLIGMPLFSKKSRSAQFLFLNRRSIFSPFLAESIKEAYGTRLDGSFPFFILDLSMLPHLFDVNVHPQKRQVRFKDPFWVKDFLAKAIEGSFRDFSFSLPPFESVSLKGEMAPFQKEEVKVEEREDFFEEAFFGPFYLVGRGKDLFLINLRNGLAKLFFENVSEKKERELFLVPIVLELNGEKMALLEEKMEEVLKRGFEVRVLGKNSIAIDSAPPFIKPAEAENLFFECLSGNETPFFKRRSFTREEAYLITKKIFRSKEFDKSIIVKLNEGLLERLFYAAH